MLLQLCAQLKQLQSIKKKENGIRTGTPTPDWCNALHSVLTILKSFWGKINILLRIAIFELIVFFSSLPYSNIFGGAGSFTREHFELINGFSNKFWGWGGEDDDLYKR